MVSTPHRRHKNRKKKKSQRQRCIDPLHFFKNTCRISDSNRLRVVSLSSSALLQLESTSLRSTGGGFGDGTLSQIPLGTIGSVIPVETPFFNKLGSATSQSSWRDKIPSQSPSQNGCPGVAPHSAWIPCFFRTFQMTSRNLKKFSISETLHTVVAIFRFS